MYKKYFGCAKLSKEIFYRGDTMKVTTEFRGGILFVRLSGNLTKDTVSILNDKVTNLVYRVGIRHVVFNVENLDNIDYKGINTLLYNSSRISGVHMDKSVLSISSLANSYSPLFIK